MRAAFACGVIGSGVIGLGLAGCVVQPPSASGDPAYTPAYDIGVRRGPGDLVVADTPEQNCNVLRLLVGGRVCKSVPPPPARPQYCTRSLAGVDCWATPNPFGYYQRGVADGPWQLTRTQEHDRSEKWPEPELSIKPPGMPVLLSPPAIIEPGPGPLPLLPPAIIEPPFTAR